MGPSVYLVELTAWSTPREVNSLDYVLDFQEIDDAEVAVVGGKGAALGELSRIDGIAVPPGFCVTTDAFGRILAGAPSIEESARFGSRALTPEDGEAIRALSAEIRRAIEGSP